MEKIKVRKIAFGSYVKLLFVSGVSMGVMLGLLSMIAGLFGAPVSTNIGSAHYSGILAGVLALVLAPLMGGLIFAWFGVVAYLPMKLAFKLSRGLTLKLEMADAKKSAEETTENLW